MFRVFRKNDHCGWAAAAVVVNAHPCEVDKNQSDTLIVFLKGLDSMLQKHFQGGKDSLVIERQEKTKEKVFFCLWSLL